MKVTKTVSKTDTEEVGEELTVLKPHVYDVLKKLVQVWLPAFSALYLGIAQQWGIPQPEKVVGTVALVTTFFGIILGVSSNRYNSSDAGTVGEFVVAEDEGGAAGYRLVLNAD